MPCPGTNLSSRLDDPVVNGLLSILTYNLVGAKSKVISTMARAAAALGETSNPDQTTPNPYEASLKATAKLIIEDTTFFDKEFSPKVRRIQKSF